MLTSSVVAKFRYNITKMIHFSAINHASKATPKLKADFGYQWKNKLKRTSIRNLKKYVCTDMFLMTNIQSHTLPHTETLNTHTVPKDTPHQFNFAHTNHKSDNYV